MRGNGGRSLLVGASLLLLVGCASKEEWDVWLSNKSHFASKEHYDFSMKNTGDSKAAVTRQDVAMAQSQGWFGKAITVAQEQILER